MNGHFDKFIKDSDEYQELAHMVRSLAQAVEEQESAAFSLQVSDTFIQRLTAYNPNSSPEKRDLPRSPHGFRFRPPLPNSKRIL